MTQPRSGKIFVAMKYSRMISHVVVLSLLNDHYFFGHITTNVALTRLVVTFSTKILPLRGLKTSLPALKSQWSNYLCRKAI